MIPCGYDQWKVLYPTCGQVGTQSPIDATFDKDFSEPEDLFIDDLEIIKAPCEQAELIVNQHTSAVALPKCQQQFRVSQVIFKGKPYNLERFHWHSPSEHTIDGARYPMEVQFMHRNPVDNSKLVIAVLIRVAPDETPAAQWMAKVQDSMHWWLHKPPEFGASQTTTNISVAWGKEGQFAPYDFIPSLKDGYYTYTGSYTSPECDTNVEWILAPTGQSVTLATLQRYRNGINEVPASDSQLALLSELIPTEIKWHADAWVTPPTAYEWKPDLKVNIRPVQPLNGSNGNRLFYKVTKYRVYGEQASDRPRSSNKDDDSGSSGSSKAFVVTICLLFGCCCFVFCTGLGWLLVRNSHQKVLQQDRKYGGMWEEDDSEVE